jgi:hypothetical protein
MTQSRRIALEGLAVVTSILLAFAIDAWWDANQLREAEAAAMEALRVELVQNREALQRSITLNEGSRVSASLFLAASPAQLRQTDFRQRGTTAHDAAASLWNLSTFDPDVGALMRFLDRNELTTDLGRTVYSAVVNWETRRVDTGEEAEALWESCLILLRGLTSYMSDLAPSLGAPAGLALINKDGPERLARFRANESLMGELIAKSQLQMIYTRELRALLQQTDQVLDILGVDTDTLPEPE